MSSRSSSSSSAAPEGDAVPAVAADVRGHDRHLVGEDACRSSAASSASRRRTSAQPLASGSRGSCRAGSATSAPG